MGNADTKPSEEIVINQQQQQQQQLQQPQASANDGVGPVHVIATCFVILLIALALRAVWKAIQKEIEAKVRRAPSIATIV